MPLVSDVTDVVLSGTNLGGAKIARNSDGVFRFHNQLSVDVQHRDAEDAVRFCNALKTEATDYYSRFSQRPLNYEDMYFMANSMSDSLSGEHLTPMPILFLERVLARLSRELKYDLSTQEGRTGAHNFLEFDVMAYISDTVSHLLWTADTSFSANDFSLILDAANVEGGRPTPIFTLNHDSVIQQVLRQSGMTFVDGFSVGNRFLRIPSWNTFDDRTASFAVYNLHGSVDWKWVRESNSERIKAAIPLVRDPKTGHLLNSHGEDLDWEDVRPILLIGSLNKPQKYSQPLYAELQHRFYEALKNTDHLIVCGYSFGDRTINDYLFGWFIRESQKSCTVICKDRKDAEGALSGSQGAICRMWRGWQEEGWLRIAESSLEKTVSEQVFV